MELRKSSLINQARHKIGRKDGQNVRVCLVGAQSVMTEREKTIRRGRRLRIEENPLEVFASNDVIAGASAV